MAEPSPRTSSPDRFLLLTLTAGSLAVLVACFWDHPLGRWLFAAAAVGMPVAWMALGAAQGTGADRGGGGLSRRLRWTLGLVLALYGGTFGGLLWLARVEGGGPAVLGLPLAAVWMLAGLWIVPLGLVTWGYMSTFDRHGLGPEDLAALRAQTGNESGSESGSESGAGADTESGTEAKTGAGGGVE